MALLGKLVTLAKSPQGQRLIAQAGKAARDPQNRERLEKVRSRIQNRGDVARQPANPEQRAADGSQPEPQRLADAAKDA